MSIYTDTSTESKEWPDIPYVGPFTTIPTTTTTTTITPTTTTTTAETTATPKISTKKATETRK